jgi:GMP synthase-like glutamine amidotransferase
MAKLTAKEKNIVELKKLIDDPIFSDLDSIKVFESHRWVVTDSGDNLIALAESKDGVEIVKHKHKQIYGFQFHPEMFESSTEGNEIFANFINIVQNKVI